MAGYNENASNDFGKLGRFGKSGSSVQKIQRKYLILG
jgi:hypothetical protein